MKDSSFSFILCLRSRCLLLLDAFTWRAESHVAKLRKAKLTAELNEAMRNGVKVAGRAHA